MMDTGILEQRLAELPLFAYFFLDPRELEFTHRVRWVCEHECPRCGKTWACPPGVGSVESCRDRCLQYENCLMIASVTEVEDISDMEETLATRGGHEELTDQVREIFRELGETEFRKLEMCAIRELFSENDGMITALGGGVLSNPFLTEEDRNMFGFLCCLDVKDEIAYERIIKNGLPPFLQDKSDPFQALCEMNRNRREIFRKQADFILEIAGESTPESTAEKIIAAYKEHSR